jgi:hypothetical protein
LFSKDATYGSIDYEAEEENKPPILEEKETKK